MSVIYCEQCDRHIDTDFNAEHFDKPLECGQDEDVLKDRSKDLFSFENVLKVNKFHFNQINHLNELMKKHYASTSIKK